MEKIYRVKLNSKGMPNFSTAVEIADRPQGEWKPFDLTWGRSIYACSVCEEAIAVPTCNGEPMYNFCPMCGANMNMKSENEVADTPQTEEKHAICNGCVYCDLPNAFHPCASCVDFSKYVGEENGDTPQTDCEDCDKYDTCPNADKGIPQTDCGWGEPITVSHSKDKED